MGGPRGSQKLGWGPPTRVLWARMAGPATLFGRPDPSSRLLGSMCGHVIQRGRAYAFSGVVGVGL